MFHGSDLYKLILSVCVLCYSQHEVASVKMFDYLINNNDLRSVLLEELTENDLEFIRELINPPEATPDNVSTIHSMLIKYIKYNSATR